MAYDVAGQRVRSVTRRGHVITHAYDARGRDTLTVIPGVGNLRRAFGGPLGQLTRLWFDSPVDSIGGVNGERRWTYDARGRLVADTSYAGSVARGRTYTYDAWERPATTTDAAGTWATRYEAYRGIADSLISPFADTLIAAVDQRGRVDWLDLRSSGPRQIITRDYAAGGELAGLQHQVAAGAGAAYTPGWYQLAESEDSIQAPLTPQWVEVPGSGAASATWRDSVVYDGWGRVLEVRQARDGAHFTAFTRRYGFDRAGNVTTPLGQESYAAATSRLLSRWGEAAQHAYTWDAAGNLAARTVVQAGDTTTWAYGWDALDRLGSVRRNGTLIARYGYDVQGRRIAKRVYSAASGGTVGYTRFGYTGGHVAFEADSAGTVGRRYLWGVGTDHLIGLREANGTRYVAVTDKLGSIRALIRQADGGWTGGMRFDPYGTLVDSSGTLLGLRYRWTGREWDGETGFYFHRARYYDPGAKRFISEDPIGYAGGENLYAYVGGAVLEARDPSGLLKAVPYTVGFAPFCTMNGSCMNYDGSMNFNGVSVYIDGVPVGAGGAGMLPSAAILAVQARGIGSLLNPRIIYEGRAVDKETCLANEICSILWAKVDGGRTDVLILYDPDYESPSTLKYSDVQDRYTIRYNPAHWEWAAARAGVPLNDGATIFGHEFGHILFRDRDYYDYGIREDNCVGGALFANDIEDIVRSTNRTRYGTRVGFGHSC